MMAFIGSVMVVIGLLTALFDMGMNGSQYAGWAPYGLVVGVIGIVLIGYGG